MKGGGWLFWNGRENYVYRKSRALHLLSEFYTCVYARTHGVVSYLHIIASHTNRVGCGCGDAAGLPLPSGSWSMRSISETDWTRQSPLSRGCSSFSSWSLATLPAPPDPAGGGGPWLPPSPSSTPAALASNSSCLLATIPCHDKPFNTSLWY